ncbi:MAG: hypothetical protein GY913_15300 [Proteobacteria bacterium]|nr:hypothetical protein [Pseudomonadota bacterium]
MGKLKFGRGKVTVEIDDDIERMIRAGIEETAPGVLSGLEDIATEVGRSAQLRWPVKSGRSKAAFGFGGRLPRKDLIEGYVENNATNDGFSYIYAIKPRGGGRSIWSSWVRTPMKRRGEQFAEELGPNIQKLMEDV